MKKSFTVFEDYQQLTEKVSEYKLGSLSLMIADRLHTIAQSYYREVHPGAELLELGQLRRGAGADADFIISATYDILGETDSVELYLSLDIHSGDLIANVDHKLISSNKNKEPVVVPEKDVQSFESYLKGVLSSAISVSSITDSLLK